MSQRWRFTKIPHAGRLTQRIAKPPRISGPNQTPRVHSNLGASPRAHGNRRTYRVSNEVRMVKIPMLSRKALVPLASQICRKRKRTIKHHERREASRDGLAPTTDLDTLGVQVFGASLSPKIMTCDIRMRSQIESDTTYHRYLIIQMSSSTTPRQNTFLVVNSGNTSSRNE